MAGNGSRAAPHQFDFIPDGLLTPLTKRIDLRTVPQGGRASGTLQLENNSTRHVRIVRVWASYPCISVDFGADDIEPKQQVSVRINLNLEDEIDFVGILGAEVRGFTSTGELAFATAVNIRAANVK
jgi:hypothetical protein